ncbi:hypothetical protein VB774_09165 [Pseudanabaena galeata UHCC 0370]|uniref:Uncharacterized protein n=1 Tax=Pseudanabaena galeata UHCC 0370 TaxID=3110310 RepID=A0ABU5THS6_9CYAN|nr:hypothetical protein [Pseudanabaena galeata]MEA5477789.1 hypothetical protein [Pseudanabaena galeata UHCC 0370]
MNNFYAEVSYPEKLDDFQFKEIVSLLLSKNEGKEASGVGIRKSNSAISEEGFLINPAEYEFTSKNIKYIFTGEEPRNNFVDAINQDYKEIGVHARNFLQ